MLQKEAATADSVHLPHLAAVWEVSPGTAAYCHQCAELLLTLSQVAFGDVVQSQKLLVCTSEQPPSVHEPGRAPKLTAGEKADSIVLPRV